MKRLFYLSLILGLILVSCNKPPEIPSIQDVIFQATTNTSGLKSSCDNPIANFALIEIDGITQQVGVFYLDDKIYTNTLKLAPGNHTLNMFVLVNDGGTPDNPDGDIIVQAAPLSGNTFANFVSKPLPFNFKVDAFYKTEIPIELLCYEAADYDDFGFAWFSIEEIAVREFCFFGDICIDDYMSYTGSLYENQRNGLQHDMPAIFKIDVIRNDNLLITYDNAEWYGEGRPLCVDYPDYSNYTDNYKFVLSILLKEGEEFNYVELYTWETTDAEQLPNIGSDNILDFVLGDCVPDADLIIPPIDEPTPTPFTGEETAFAYGGEENASCFIEDGFGNWGWTNGKYNEGDYTLELLAGVGDCDQTKGYDVGEVLLSYHNGSISVSYNVTSTYELQAVQLYVGYEKYPEKNGTPTVAPGQYTIIDDELNSGTTSYTFNLDGFSEKIYIIAHADVLGN
ncbi:MAG: hypothetical protein J7K39_01650 [Bacteroidales bacterium]|nr:hypothetical protein [Bacteroidales bacterium]